MSLSGRVPLGSTGATYAQLPNETISNITLRAAVVNRIASRNDDKEEYSEGLNKLK